MNCSRVGLEVPTIEVRFEDLTVSAEAYVGSRALPTIQNSCANMVEVNHVGLFEYACSFDVLVLETQMFTSVNVLIQTGFLELSSHSSHSKETITYSSGCQWYYQAWQVRNQHFNL